MGESTCAATASRYRMGMCDVFALALHDVYGWPLAVIEGVRADPDDPRALILEPAHAVACAPNGWYADVDGLHRRAPLLARCLFHSRPARVRVRRVSRVECAETFTSEPLDVEAVSAAVAWISTLPARWSASLCGAPRARRTSHRQT